jgi:hypothetical protein
VQFVGQVHVPHSERHVPAHEPAHESHVPPQLGVGQVWVGVHPQSLQLVTQVGSVGTNPPLSFDLSPFSRDVTKLLTFSPLRSNFNFFGTLPFLLIFNFCFPLNTNSKEVKRNCQAEIEFLVFCF